MTSTSGEFESALRRLEEIVAKLERENVGLDESVALFKEGKTLALRCEQLLKDAQSSIESTARGDVAAGDSAISAAPGTTAMPTTRASAGTATLFASSVPDDADPDL